MRDLFQIYEIKEHNNHAGSKAPGDVRIVAEEEGFKTICFKPSTDKKTFLAKIIRQADSLLFWIRCYNKITKYSIVLVQFPFNYKHPIGIGVLHLLKVRKKMKIVVLVHDVDELRGLDSKKRYNYQRRMKYMLLGSDVIIVHNSVMLEWFVDRGVSPDKLVNLQIFDYLCNTDEKRTPDFKQSISIAGNLSKEKSGYIYQLGELNNITVNLYGPNYGSGENHHKNMRYCGSFSPEEIPSKLTEGFGLVWDGETIDGCQGSFGQYLKYNNPHKLSLFLAAGLPIVIWKQAAEAEFVQKNGLGICVEELTELSEIFEKLTEEQYFKMAENVRKIGGQLRAGKYTRDALRVACYKLEANGKV